MEPIEVLGKFIGAFKDAPTPWRVRPFLATRPTDLEFQFRSDAVWSVGTCGHTLMAYKGNVAEPALYSPTLPFLWVPKDTNCIQVDRKELLDWVGMEDSGLVEYEERIIGKSLQGKVLDVVVDLRKLAHLVESFQSDKLYVWESTHVMRGVKSLAFDSEDELWRGILAGLDGDPEPKKVFCGSGAEYGDAFRMMLDL